MPKLSVIIIAKNEAHDIRDCLESIKWADEIVVLDSGSSDGTQAICREYTDKVFETDWPGFGPQKNRALQLATGDWVLSLDADERVTEDLHQEIINAIDSTQYVGFEIPRKSIYCGKLIKYGAWHSKAHLRLVKNGHGKFNDVIVHESLVVTGKIGNLKSPIMHYTYKNLDEAIEKLNRYSSASALQRYREGKRGGLCSALLHSWWSFIYGYFLRLGFLDGKEGFMIAVSNAEYCYYRYLKLMILSSTQAKADLEQS
jgi:glycosyltransferase involved in cell wall biosynthesis